MNFKEFNEYLNKFVEDNNIDSLSDFRNLALYRLIKETSLNDLSDYKMMISDSGNLEIVQCCGYSLVRGLSIKSGYLESKGPDYENYVSVYDDLEKSMVLPFYQALVEKNSIEDIQDYVVDAYKKAGDIDIQDSMAVKDNFARILGGFLVSRINYQKPFNSDSTVTTQHLVEFFLKTAIENTNSPNLLKTKSNDMLQSILLGHKTNIDKNFLTDGNPDGIHLSQKAFERDDSIINAKHYEGTFTGSLLKNIHNKETLIDNMFNEFALPKLKRIAEIKLKFFEKKPTIENKLNNTKLNQLFSKLRLEKPKIFLENEIHSFRHGIKRNADYPNFTSLSQVVDKFNMSDKFDDANLTIGFTDQYKIRQNPSYYIRNDKDVIRFIGETDMSVKYLISGSQSTIKNGLKVLTIDNIMMINENHMHNSVFLKIGYDELFKYCKENSVALVFDKSDITSTFPRSFHLFYEALTDNKHSVFVIEDNSKTNKINLLHNTRLDIATIKKNERELLAAVEQGELKNFEDELLKKQIIKQKI